MAIFVDLDDDNCPEESKETNSAGLEAEGGAISIPYSEILPLPSRQTTPRHLTWLAAAWPVISSIASHLDHNDLSNLANTCKQMRQNMLQYRRNLLDTSLICSTTLRDGNAYSKQSKRSNQSSRSRKVLCARDFVARCGTCGEPTCRV